MDYAVKPRAWLVLYLAAVVAITFIHAPSILAGLLVAAVAASGTRRWKLLRRALLAVLAFNLTISLGYLGVALWQGNFVTDTLLLINLRVLLLVYLGFWFVTTVDLLGALAGWPLATLLATLSIGQIKTFERILRDFRLAFESRNLMRPTMLDRSRHAAAQAQTLLDKSLASANEAALAMRSRGAFDD
jgi:cobalt/nickel transport system permease protein